MNFFAYKQKMSNNETDEIEMVNTVFEDPLKIESHVKKDEGLIVWSCEFSKK